MPITSQYIFIASMDVVPEKEALFNEVFDSEHAPILRKVPGVRSVTRLRTATGTLMIGGAAKPLTGDGAPTYTTIYEIDSPDVLASAAWAEAVEHGRWPTEVRPYTTNRHHIIRKVM